MTAHKITDDLDEILITKEVAAWLKIGLKKIQEMARKNKIPACRIGRQWRFRKLDIDGWLDGKNKLTNGN